MKEICLQETPMPSIRAMNFLIINFIFPTMTPVNWNTKFITESDLIEGLTVYP